MEPKTIFKSKTALLSILLALIGGLGTVFDPLRDWLRDHVESILMWAGGAGVLVRRLTKGRMTILPEEKELPPPSPPTTPAP